MTINVNFNRWRKLHNVELHKVYVYPSSSIIRMIKTRRMQWLGHVAGMGEKNTFRVLMGKPEEKKPVGRPRRKWVDNIKINLKETEWVGMNWIDVAQYEDQWKSLLNTVMSLRVP
jgi:hypothetical protein